MSHVSGLDFVRFLPYLAETHRAVESVKNGQRHGHVRDDRPGPKPVKVQLERMRVRAGLFQRVDGPHRQVRDQQKGHDLPARLLADLLARRDRATRGVEDEDRLTGGLHDAAKGGDDDEQGVILEGEVAADDGEGGVDEHAGLGGDQEDVVELEVACAVEPELVHLAHADEGGQGGHAVEGELADVDLHDGETDELGARDEDEEEDEGDDGEDEDEDADEEALVGSCAVDAVVVGRASETGFRVISSCLGRAALREMSWI